MTEEGDSTYDNSNRAFLQAFLARSTLTLDEAKPILAAILTTHEKRETLPNDVTETDFNSYIASANRHISSFDLEIRSTYHQTSRTRIYALVNATDDPIAQLATSHTADEISFLKRLLDAMFETYNTPRYEIMAITTMQALNYYKAPTGSAHKTQNGSETQGSAGQSLTIGQAEKMLKVLVEEGWFEKSAKGYYSLSPRALMELRGWLEDTYNDAEDEDDDENRVLKIKQCFACKELITVGQRCPDLACPCRLHDICRQNYFRTQKSTKCPLCRTAWTDDKQRFVGERVAIARDKSLQEKRRSRTGPSTKRRAPAVVEQTELGNNEAEDGG